MTHLSMPVSLRPAIEPAIVETPFLRKAAFMAEATLATEQNRIGQIVGAPGTGKSIATHFLARAYADQGAMRISAFHGMRTKPMFQEIARALGVDRSGTASTVLYRCRDHVRGRLLIVDEAQHLYWQQLEMLRYLADENGMALILAGTPLFDHYANKTAAAVYLAQLVSRIGAKRVEFGVMSLQETGKRVLLPRFGAHPPEAAKAFHRHCKGNWRVAVELAEGCRRIMTSNAVDLLSLDVVAAAVAAWSPSTD